MNNHSNLANRFENLFERLLSGEELPLCYKEISIMFECIASNLFANLPERKSVYFDGVVNCTSKVRKSRQIEFEGEMWIGEHNKQWKEPFRARVTDKRITTQGIWIKMWIGTDKAEGELFTAFNRTNEIEQRLS